MAGLLRTLVVLALLAATATAFVVTERLKLERSPITGTRVDRVFSPVCECPRDVAVISFRLRKRATLTVDLLDRERRPIRTLVRERREEPGRVVYVWDGLDAAGQVVPEGVYRPRVQLEEHGRTIVLPNPIRVDTTPPEVRSVRVFPRVFSPDGDGRRDRVTVRFELDDRARAMLLVNGKRRALTKFRAAEGRLAWFGLVRGRPVRPGRYELRVRAVDRAGNRSRSSRPLAVRVRYVELGRERIRVLPGRRFRVRVDADAAGYRWLFAGRRGRGRTPLLRLRAPAEPGRYTLYVVVGRHADRAEVVVARPRPAAGR
ncbi:MAG TPA: hypothetical protein VNJ53_03980 [Gaiellaceae bacterium]|nr:hypothetical protein [Gaiellaceae bacterium]